ncbi:hypothetical protein GCM10010404_35380 [Nonomuraea africana]
MSSGQEKDRLEQTMDASDMREDLVRERGRAEAARQGDRDLGNDDQGHIGGGHVRLPGPINLRYHPEMSSSPATSGLLASDLKRLSP